MKKKSKVRTCKCGAGIPPFSPHNVCYTCLKNEPNKNDVVEVLKQKIKKNIIPIVPITKKTTKKKPKVISKKKLRKKALVH